MHSSGICSRNDRSMESTDFNQSDNSIDGVGNTKSSDKNKSKEFSDVWQFFLKKGSGKTAVSECKGCKKIYKGGGNVYGTSTLRRHIQKCPKLKFHDVGQMFIGHEGKIVNRKMNPKIARELLAAAIIKHDLPFSFVEYDGIRTFLQYVNPNLPCISRNTLVSDINKLYLKEKATLKEALGKLKNRICLTSDVWTACTSEGYICLTAHYVDENWKLNSKILNFDHFPPPHSGVELASKVLGFLKDWGIETKIFSLTLDNASSNDTMQNILKDQLSNYGNLVCGGEFFHIRCSAHILNLIVQDGLKLGGETGGPLSKVRESVKYVKSSEGRMKKFQECVKGVRDIDSSVGLRLDVVTRWNSTYLMLDSAIKYKKAFSSLPLSDRTYTSCPTTEEWTKVEKLNEFLEPFYEITNLMSGSSYSTSNLYFMQVWKVECLLKENLSNEDILISDMCKKMIEKFDKYWSEYSVVLAFGAVLDPRFKYQMLEFFYSEVESESTKVQEKMTLVKSKLYKLFEDYNTKTSTKSSELSSSNSQSQSTSSPLVASSKSSKNKRLLDVSITLIFLFLCVIIGYILYILLHNMLHDLFNF